MFVAVQKSLYEHFCVQVVAAWQVFPPPSTFCLHIVVSVRDSQSMLDMQDTKIQSRCNGL